MCCSFDIVVRQERPVKQLETMLALVFNVLRMVDAPSYTRKAIRIAQQRKYPISGVDDGILLIPPSYQGGEWAFRSPYLLGRGGGMGNPPPPYQGGESPRLPLDLSLGGGIAVFTPPTTSPEGGESMLSPPYQGGGNLGFTLTRGGVTHLCREENQLSPHSDTATKNLGDSTKCTRCFISNGLLNHYYIYTNSVSNRHHSFGKINTNGYVNTIWYRNVPSNSIQSVSSDAFLHI